MQAVGRSAIHNKPEGCVSLEASSAFYKPKKISEGKLFYKWHDEAVVRRQKVSVSRTASHCRLWCRGLGFWKVWESSTQVSCYTSGLKKGSISLSTQQYTSAIAKHSPHHAIHRHEEYQHCHQGAIDGRAGREWGWHGRAGQGRAGQLVQLLQQQSRASCPFIQKLDQSTVKP